MSPEVQTRTHVFGKPSFIIAIMFRSLLEVWEYEVIFVGLSNDEIIRNAQDTTKYHLNFF